MKADELIETLNEILKPGLYGLEVDEDEDEISSSDIGYGNIPSEVKSKITKKLGKWEYVLEADRPFGEEDTQRTVLHFKKHDIYVAYDGYYCSWSGGNFDDAHFYEVKPVEKTYTDWEAVK
jgi:hypothetical protein